MTRAGKTMPDHHPTAGWIFGQMERRGQGLAGSVLKFDLFLHYLTF
jgi:hypothetical protein